MLTVFTATIFPELIKLWYKVLVKDPTLKLRIYDSTQEGLPNFDSIILVRNNIKSHGLKMDHCIKNCDTEYLLICDDDVFIPNTVNLLNYGIKALNENPKAAVYSYIPRTWWKITVGERWSYPMGSYCILIKPEIFRRESISMNVVRKENKHRTGTTRFGLYDTTDLATEQLLEKGYDILITPDVIRNELVYFMNTSNCYYSCCNYNVHDFLARPDKHLCNMENIDWFEGFLAINLIDQINRETYGEGIKVKSQFSHEELEHIASEHSIEYKQLLTRYNNYHYRLQEFLCQK